MGNSQSRAVTQTETRSKKEKSYLKVLEVVRQHSMKAGLRTDIADLRCAAAIETTCTALRDRSRSRTTVLLGSAPDASFAYRGPAAIWERVQKDALRAVLGDLPRREGNWPTVAIHGAGADAWPYDEQLEDNWGLSKPLTEWSVRARAAHPSASLSDPPPPQHVVTDWPGRIGFELPTLPLQYDTGGAPGLKQVGEGAFDAAIIALVTAVPHITSLDASKMGGISGGSRSCRNLSDKALAAIGEGCTELEVLHLPESSSISDTGIATLTSCRKLKSLDFR